MTNELQTERMNHPERFWGGTFLRRSKIRLSGDAQGNQTESQRTQKTRSDPQALQA